MERVVTGYFEREFMAQFPPSRLRKLSIIMGVSIIKGWTAFSLLQQSYKHMTIAIDILWIKLWSSDQLIEKLDKINVIFFRKLPPITLHIAEIIIISLLILFYEGAYMYLPRRFLVGHYKINTK